jgi:shikimate kinase
MWTSFIGFMASGKSTVTRLLQTGTSRPHVCLDDLIAARTGLSIPEIFAQQGEPEFRRHELDALASLAADRHLVVDCGGGIVTTPAAVDLLRRRGVVMWLDAPWETIRSRLLAADQASRPLVGGLGLPGLENLYRRRRPLYAAAADFRLDGGSLDPSQVARAAMLRGLLWQRRREEEQR